MKVLIRRQAMTRLTTRWTRTGESVGFVPTMGALHAGHASLIRRAVRENDRVVVSVFVNPAQFGPKEDLASYPRVFPADRRLCASLGAAALYHPVLTEVYPAGFESFVEVPALSDRLCGRSRPGHFRGVATVVLKLFETVRPTRAYFGEKDFQQLAVIRRMTRDLDLPVRVVGCPIVRESDGLALSSRNRNLTPAQRASAPLFHKALKDASTAARRGLPLREVAARARRDLRRLRGLRVDYVELVDSLSLDPIRGKRPQTRMRLLGAVFLGSTRLIDNLPVSC